MVKAGYKQTEVGEIPEDWDVRKFSDNFVIYAGGDVPKDSLSQFQTSKYCNPIYANALQNRGLYGFTERYRSKGNAITVTARGSLGHAEYRDQPFFPIVRLLVLEPNGSLDPRFTTYCINDRVEFAIESTGVPQLTAPQIAQYSIGAPTDESEQKAIAAALSDVDALIACLEKLIEKKRDIKTATMQQLLTGKKRLPGFDGKWVNYQLGEIGQFRKGKGIKKNDVMEDGIPCIRYGEIYTRHHDYIKRFFSYINSVVSSEASPIRAGDLLFAGSGETAEEIGKCVAYLSDDQAFAGGDIIVYRAPEQDAKYLGFLMNHHSVVIQKMRMGQGDAVVHIHAKNLANIEVSLPPIDEQKAISDVLSDMDIEIGELETRLAKTKAIKQGMMQELLTGRTRLV